MSGTKSGLVPALWTNKVLRNGAKSNSSIQEAAAKNATTCSAFFRYFLNQYSKIPYPTPAGSLDRAV